MEIQQLIEKWTKEMADIKIHIKKHEDTFGHPAVTSRERLEAISEMLADIKQLKISCNPLDSLPSEQDEIELHTKFLQHYIDHKQTYDKWETKDIAETWLGIRKSLLAMLKRGNDRQRSDYLCSVGRYTTIVNLKH